MSATPSQPTDDVSIDLHSQFGYQTVHVHTSKVLGTGSYGSVVRATLDDLPCAAKILHTIFFRFDDPGAADFAAGFDQECRILRNLKHPCIVQFLGVVQDPGNRRAILLMELMEESLTGFLERSPNPLPYHVQVSITHDITQALAYLHANKIIHRDLSSNNVLVNTGSQVKVTDFGMSKIVEANPCMSRSKLTRCPGTPVFMPPEALRPKPRYSYKLDTFSAGVLIIQIITRTFPAPTDAEEDPPAEEKTPTGEEIEESSGIRIVLVPELKRRKKDIDKVPSDHSLLPIARHCLKDREQERPTAAQLCQSLEQLKAACAYKGSKAAAVRRVSKPEDEVDLYLAAHSGDVSAVRRLVAANVNVDCTPTTDGMTPLMSASLNGHVEVVRVLIGSKAQLNTQNEDGWTALHLAAQEGNVDVVRLLTETGAQFNIQAKNGFTALHLAAQEGKVDVVRLLTEARAQLNIQTKEGSTPLYIASQNGHTDVVDTLIRAGASVNQARTDTLSIPLGIAAEKGHLDTVKRLVEGGANINHKNKNGTTSLHVASHKGHTDVVDYLIRAGANINLAAKDGVRPIDTARTKGHSDIIRLLERAELETTYSGIDHVVEDYDYVLL